MSVCLVVFTNHKPWSGPACEIPELHQRTAANADAVLAICRCSQCRLTDGPVAQTIPVSGHGRYVGSAHGRHTEPRHDCRAWRGSLAGRVDGGNSFAGCAVQSSYGVSLGHAPLGIWLAPRAVYLDGHHAAVCRAGLHAVRIADFVGSGTDTNSHVAEPGCSWLVFPAGRYWPSNLTNCRSCAGH